MRKSQIKKIVEQRAKLAQDIFHICFLVNGSVSRLSYSPKGTVPSFLNKKTKYLNFQIKILPFKTTRNKMTRESIRKMKGGIGLMR